MSSPILLWTLFDAGFVLLLNNGWHLIDLYKAASAFSSVGDGLVFVKIIFLKFYFSRSRGTAMIQNSACLGGCCLMRGYSCMERVRLSDPVIIWISPWMHRPCPVFYLLSREQAMIWTQLLVQRTAVSETLAGSVRTQLDPGTRATNTCVLFDTFYLLHICLPELLL